MGGANSTVISKNRAKVSLGLSLLNSGHQSVGEEEKYIGVNTKNGRFHTNGPSLLNLKHRA
jgi:hypothetical protein